MTSKQVRLAGLCLGLLSGLSAAAEQKKLAAVAVGLEPDQEGRALELWRALDAAAARGARYAYVDVARRSAPDDAARAQEAQARTVLEAARAAYVNLDMPGAAGKATQALGLLEASDLSRSFPQAVEALALKALALQAQDNPAAADALADLYTVAPYYRFSATQTNPRFIALSDKVRRTVAAAPSTALQVSPREASAWVFVDGSFRGISPVEVATLAPGKHYVTLVAPGFELRQAAVTTTVGKEETFAPALAPTPEGRELRSRLEQVVAGLRQGGASRALAGLRGWSGADELLVVALTREGRTVRAVLLRSSAEGLLREVREVGAGTTPDALAQAALGLLERSLEPAPLEAQASTSGNRRIPAAWGYAALGAGAFAALGGVFVGIDARNRATQTRAIPQLDDATYDSTVSAIRGEALLADGLFVVALAGAGVGTWLLLSGAEPAPAAGSVGVERVGVAPIREGGVVTLSGRF